MQNEGSQRYVQASSVSNSETAHKRSCAVKASKGIAVLSKKKAPRGVSVQHETSSESCTLHQEILNVGQDLFSKYIERNSTIIQQKAVALNIFSIALSEGGRILDACQTASRFTGFSLQVIRKWAEIVFRDFIGATVNIDDVDDEALEAELMSNRGKHPKWVSLMHDESFKLDATEFVREHGFVKGAPNLTLMDFVHWVHEKWDVEVCEETARVWLHGMGFP